MLPRVRPRTALLLLCLPTAAPGAVVLPNLPPGSQYQIAFVTAGGRDATNANIAAYNTFVTQEAALNPSLPSASWYAVASTPTVDARNNAPTYPTIPIYNTHGQLIADGSGSFWFPAHYAAINYDQYGIKQSSQAWTGSQTNGTRASPLGGGVNVTIAWASNYADSTWVYSYAAGATAIVPLYALSSPITAAGPSISSTWSARTGGDWYNPANWTTSIPGGSGAEAYFAATIPTPQTVYSNTNLTLGKLRFNSPQTYVLAGTATLTFQSPAPAPSVVQVDQGTHKINLPLTLAADTTFAVTAGAQLLLSDPVTLAPGVHVTQSGTGTVTYQSTLTLQSGAALTLAGPAQLATLTLGPAAAATLATQPSAYTVQVDQLSIDPSSTLDLAGNTLACPNGSPALLRALLRSGFHDGDWTGPGIRSSVAANDPRHATAVAYQDATGTLTLRLAPTGDANLDGAINPDDYALLDRSLANSRSDVLWQDGDFNYDGTITSADYLLIDRTFGQAQGFSPGFLSQRQSQFGPDYVSALLTPLPDPATLPAAVPVAALLSRRNRRARHP